MQNPHFYDKFFKNEGIIDKSYQIIDYFFNNYQKLHILDCETLRDIITYSWSIMNDQCDGNDIIKSEAFAVIVKIISLGNLPISERFAIYFQLVHKKFLNTIYDSISSELKNAYFLMCSDIEEQIPQQLLSPISDCSPSNNVVITTGQFLSLAHAPTRRVLDYAYTIAD